MKKYTLELPSWPMGTGVRLTNKYGVSRICELADEHGGKLEFQWHTPPVSFELTGPDWVPIRADWPNGRVAVLVFPPSKPEARPPVHSRGYDPEPEEPRPEPERWEGPPPDIDSPDFDAWALEGTEE